MTTGDGQPEHGGPAVRVAPARRLSRRALLGGAVTIGAGAGAARLVFAPPQPVDSPRKSSRQRPHWESPPDSEPARIAQLLRRATFGVTAHDLEAAFQEGFDRTVERLVETPPAEPAGLISGDDPLRGSMLGGDKL